MNAVFPTLNGTGVMDITSSSQKTNDAGSMQRIASDPGVLWRLFMRFLCRGPKA
jgi:hypothetical protein